MHEIHVKGAFDAGFFAGIDFRSPVKTGAPAAPTSAGPSSERPRY